MNTCHVNSFEISRINLSDFSINYLRLINVNVMSNGNVIVNISNRTTE